MISPATITTIQSMATELQDIEPKANSVSVYLARKRARLHLKLVEEIRDKKETAQ